MLFVAAGIAAFLGRHDDALVILSVVPRFESRMKNDWYSDLSIHLQTTDLSIESVHRIIEAHGIQIKGVDWQENIDDETRVVLFHVKYKKGERLTLPGKVISELRKLSNVKTVHWHG